VTKEQPMKRKITTTDQLAAKMGYRIRRKRDGRLQIVSKARSTKARPVATCEFPPMTMAEVEDQLKLEWEHECTMCLPCGTPYAKIPPGKDRSRLRVTVRP
jgi:hypothetical protein